MVFPAASVEVAVDHPTFAAAMARLNWAEDESGTLAVDDIVLEGGANVRGRAVDPNGNPVPAALVVLHPLGDQGGMEGRILP